MQAENETLTLEIPGLDSLEVFNIEPDEWGAPLFEDSLRVGFGVRVQNTPEGVLLVASCACGARLQRVIDLRSAHLDGSSRSGLTSWAEAVLTSTLFSADTHRCATEEHAAPPRITETAVESLRAYRRQMRQTPDLWAPCLSVVRPEGDCGVLLFDDIPSADDDGGAIQRVVVEGMKFRIREVIRQEGWDLVGTVAVGPIRVPTAVGTLRLMGLEACTSERGWRAFLPMDAPPSGAEPRIPWEPMVGPSLLLDGLNCT